MSILDKIKNAVQSKELVLVGDRAKQELKSQNAMLIGIEEQSDAIQNAVPDMEDRIIDIDSGIVKTKQEIADTKRNITKEMRKADPDLASSYNRQLILLNDKLDYLKEQKGGMSVALKKTKLVMREAQITGEILKEKIEDAKICYELSGQIKLVGNALSSFGKMANKEKGGIIDLGAKVEGLTKSINEIHGGRLMAIGGGKK